MRNHNGAAPGPHDEWSRKAIWSKKAMQTIETHYSDIGCIGGKVPQDKESPQQEISARFLPGCFPKSQIPLSGVGQCVRRLVLT